MSGQDNVLVLGLLRQNNPVAVQPSLNIFADIFGKERAPHHEDKNHYRNSFKNFGFPDSVGIFKDNENRRQYIHASR